MRPKVTSRTRLLPVTVMGIYGLRFMLVPLIAAVPLAAASGPPLLARRAPGSRALLNCCPFTETVAGGTGALRWLTVLFGLPLNVADAS